MDWDDSHARLTIRVDAAPGHRSEAAPPSTDSFRKLSIPTFGFTFGLTMTKGDRWIIAFALMVATGLAAHLGGPLRLLIPTSATLLAVYLVRAAPASYVAFTLWLWFLSPLVRRLIDLQIGFMDPSTILLTPFLVTAVSLIPLIGKLTRPSTATPQGSRGSFPMMFFLPLLGIVFGVPTGLHYYSPATVFAELLNWVPPLLFGWYIAVYTEHRATIEKTVARTMLLSLPVLGAYGVFQFFAPPEWDRNWLINIPGVTSMGSPEPFLIRVFGTMHSPAVLGLALTIGIAVWLAAPHPLLIPGGSLALAALLLTQARTAWLALGVSLLLAVSTMSRKVATRLAVTVVLLVLIIIPVLTVDPFVTVVGDRMHTITEPGNDNSAHDRMLAHRETIGLLADRPLGYGLGTPETSLSINRLMAMRDSILVSSMVQLGVFGGSLYLLGLFFMFGSFWRSYHTGNTQFASAFACAGFGLLSQMYAGSVTTGPVGVLTCMLAGLSTRCLRNETRAVSANGQDFDSNV